MSLQRQHFSLEINRPAGDVFRWHERPGAFERLTPPWESIEVVAPAKGIGNGSRAKFRQRVGPLAFDWEVEHHGYVENREFRDRAVRGPFSEWEHLHRVVADGTGHCRLVDEIAYRIPAGSLGRAVAGTWIQGRLDRLFAFRRRRLFEDLDMAARYGAVRPMRFLISGASGLIGEALIPFLASQGHEVVRLVRRRPANANEVFWAPEEGTLDHHDLKEIDAVIHLAGANIARRWTAAVREEIWNSRILGTRTLVNAMNRMRHRPFVFVGASGIGVYGSRGGETLGEDSPAGSGFLASLCEAWEAETAAVEELGVRPVMLRTGIVLTPRGGALARFLPIFRAGLGGRVGEGDQWMSWISIDDLIGAYYHAVLDQRCIHEVNAVAPNPVTHTEFAATLARVLGRPARFPVPAPALRLAFGEMANEALLASARVVPERLVESGFRFRSPQLEDALRFLLGRSEWKTPQENREAEE